MLVDVLHSHLQLDAAKGRSSRFYSSSVKVFCVSHDIYQNPLNTRYASREMSALWSEQRKHSTWRRLWVALAESVRELGLDISQAQIDELRQLVDEIDFAKAAAYEKELRHDVMAHVHTYRDQCPTAGGIIHLLDHFHPAA